MNSSGGRTELMLLVAGWLGHDSNIEAQLPGLCVSHPPGRPVAVAGWRRGADAQGPRPFTLLLSLCPREARIRGTCLGPRGTNGATDAGEGSGATHIECRLCALNTVQTVPLK